MAFRHGMWIGAAFLIMAACGSPSAPSPETATSPTAEPQVAATTPDCPGQSPGEMRPYWGDLHVHTAYSLDAYGFGTLTSPADAFRFARGEPFDLPTGSMQLARPLDFMAVTDHAEWLDIMHICTDPEQADDLYCQSMRANSTRLTGLEIFRTIVHPTIASAEPAPAPICDEDPERCFTASLGNWQRVQEQANAANDPCEFTALIGFEWTATPNYVHTHRNVIFASDAVTPEAIDYLRFPTVEALWEQLDRHCRLEDGCDAVTIPHNTNMGNGLSFDVESAGDRSNMLRARYERFLEIIQEKGASECLPAYGTPLEDNECNFELFVTDFSRPKAVEDFSEEGWEKMRGTYARGLLMRGLANYEQGETGDPVPLQLGFIGSTDGHTGVGGFTDEAAWQGSVFGFGDFDRNMTRLDFNPGGLAGVWAEANTRPAIFDALKRREVFGTSGTRLAVRFSAAVSGEELVCGETRGSVAMGSAFDSAPAGPVFMIEAMADSAPLASIEIVKGSWSDDTPSETVETIWTANSDERSACVVWQDPDFDPEAPAFWYPRILEVETPRWSKFQCEAADRCDEFPGADRMIQERAWGSPIWHLPDRTQLSTSN